MKTIKEMEIDFKLWKEYDNGELPDFIFDMKDVSFVFDSFEVNGSNFMFRRGGHLGSVLTIDLSQYEYDILSKTISNEVGFNG